MQPLSKTALGVTAGAAAMILLDGRARAAVTHMRRVLAPKPGAEKTIEGAVRDKLVRLTPHGRAVHPSVDHGCVVLTGDVLTEERALIVREVAGVAGVDSVVDLLNEHRSPEGVPDLVTTGPSLPTVPRVRGIMARTRPRALRVAATGVGLGLAVSGFRIRGALGVPLGVAGGVLMAAGIAGAAGAGALANVTRIRPVVSLDAAVVVHAAAEDVFAVLRALEDTPKILGHVRTVERRSARRYRWSLACAGDAAPIAWDIEMTSLLYNRRIAWRSVKGARVRMIGDVRLQRLAPDATRVIVHLSYALPYGRDGRAIRELLGDDPDLQLAEDLQRLEAVLASASQMRLGSASP